MDKVEVRERLNQLEDVLTERQIKYCHEYIKCLNGAEAARKAGYSEKNARKQSTENKTKPDIREYIKLLQSDLEYSTGLTNEAILLSLKDMFFATPSDLRDNWDDLKKWKDIPDATKRALSEINTETTEYNGIKTTKVKFKLQDRVRLAAEIGKRLGHYEPEKLEVDVTSDGDKVSGVSMAEVLAAKKAREKSKAKSKSKKSTK